MENMLKRLSGSMALYKCFFEEHPKASCALTPTGEILLINGAFSSLSGYLFEDIKGKHYHELISSSCTSRTKEAFKKALKGNSAEVETILLTKEGETQQVSIYFFPIFENGTLKGIFAEVEDTSHIQTLRRLTHGQNQILKSITKNKSFEYIMNDIISLFEDATKGKVFILVGSDTVEEMIMYSSVSGQETMNIPFELRMNHLTISQNIETDTRWDKHRDFLNRHNFKSGYVFPIFNEEKEQLGTFSLFLNETNAIDERILETVKEGGYLASIALQHYRSKEKIQLLAFQDPLTGLSNRRLFDEKLKEVFERSRAKEKEFSVLFIDLDRFKVINDTYGHKFGDTFLEKVAGRIKSCVRSTDLVSRRGGDEFTVLLENGSFKAAENIARRIVEQLEQPFIINGVEVSTSPSIGIGVFPYHGQDTDELLRRADEAMYQAKREGGNMFKFHDEFLEQKLQEKLQIEKHLQKALKNNELSLHYQPKVSLHSGEIEGVEALIRWVSPVLGFVPPAKFIPIAEETGLIVPIGKWVVETACEELKKWEHTKYSNLSISINLSIKQFFKPDFVTSIKETIEQTSINPSLLELEITESMTMNVEQAKTILTELKALGVMISVDDFGTGYSSLSYLSYFPFDAVKVERSFISALSQGKQSLDILRSIFLISKTLQYQVVAEGVETKEQLDILKQLDCDLVQGYFFSKPLPKEALEDFYTAFTEENKKRTEI